MIKNITLLGSTGSIGQNTLNVVRHLGPSNLQIKALAARSNIALLEEQAKEFNPELVAVFDRSKAAELQKKIPHIPVLGGIEGIAAAASIPSADFAVSAIGGTLGLMPTIEAIKSGKTVGLANKETLISGGELVIQLARERKVNIIPIDSEHSAIFQCLNGQEKGAIRRLILTASGGPFRTYSHEQLKNATVDQALCHPNWTMGRKVTVDSSTLMNKGLEMIEAHWLFGVSIDDIEVVIHPQSIIHSMVEFDDASIIAQLSEPTMTIPIQYALTYPHRVPSCGKPLDFTRSRSLEFFNPDTEKFRCLSLAYDAIRAGGSMPCFMNGANEVLVNRFLEKEIPWTDLSLKLDRLMMAHSIEKITSFEQAVEIDQMARQLAVEI